MIVLPRLLVNPHSMIAFNRFNQLDILVQLRRFKVHVALNSDLEKAFLQISVAEGDQDYLYLWFLWLKDIMKKGSPLQAITCRFARVLFGLSLSPFLLNDTIRYHLKQYESSPPTSLDSIYIDDIVTGADTKDVEWWQKLYTDDSIR